MRLYSNVWKLQGSQRGACGPILKGSWSRFHCVHMTQILHFTCYPFCDPMQISAATFIIARVLKEWFPKEVQQFFRCQGCRCILLVLGSRSLGPLVLTATCFLWEKHRPIRMCQRRTKFCGRLYRCKTWKCLGSISKSQKHKYNMLKINICGTFRILTVVGFSFHLFLPPKVCQVPSSLVLGAPNASEGVTTYSAPWVFGSWNVMTFETHFPKSLNFGIPEILESSNAGDCYVHFFSHVFIIVSSRYYYYSLIL